MSNIDTFMDNFQDNYVKRELELSLLGTNIGAIELNYLDSVLSLLREELAAINNLSRAATQDALQHYTKLFEVFNKKLDYIEDTTEVFNYMNTTFDRDVICDIHNFNLKGDGISYDSKERALTLKSISTLYKCPKVVTTDMITFYNTSVCSHSGLYFESEFIDLLDVSQISIRRTDGTVLDLDITSEDLKTYIKHESLISAQIEIKFNVESTDISQYLNTVELHLIDFSYEKENNVVLESVVMNAGSLLSFVASATTPEHTYVNLNVIIELLDVNGNSITTDRLLLPINSPYVCKRVDQLNYNEVDTLIKLYVRDKSTSVGLSKPYIESLEFKEEYYVLYKTKESVVNKINKYITKLGNTSFKLNDISKQVRISPILELYSFKERNTPAINYLTGVSKNVEV